MRTGMTALAAALAAALVFSPGAPPGPGDGRALAATEIDWDNKRDAARAHAAEIKQAWASLASWIERRPQTGDPDAREARGPHEWMSGPASPGIRTGEKFAVVTQGATPADRPVWLDGWTERGLSFRFCDQVLAVFAETDLRGVDMVTVAVEGGLQIIDSAGTRAEGVPQSGYPDYPENPSETFPLCLGTLPAGHVALVATATDPFHWTATRRRIEYNDWELRDACNTGETGHIRYSQARPIELHPWARHPAGVTGYPVGCTPGMDPDCRDIEGKPVDMAPRWEADCTDRRDGTFDYDDPPGGPYGDRAGVDYPPHGQCDPLEDDAIARNHLDAAKMTSTCRDVENEKRHERQRAQVIHFYDALCKQAQGVSKDSSTWLDETDYAPNPPNPGIPPDSACALVGPGTTANTGCACPPDFSDDPWAGKGRKIEKIRWIWLQPISNSDEIVGRKHRKENSHANLGTPVGRRGGYGWGQNKRRFHPNPGGGWNADCVQNSERNYSNCYRIDTVACGSEAAQAVGSTTRGNSSWTGFTIDRNGDGNPDDKWGGDGDPPAGSGWKETNFNRVTTGEVKIKVWSNSAGTGERHREEYSNNCAYSASALEEGCNWSDTDGDGACDD